MLPDTARAALAVSRIAPGKRGIGRAGVERGAPGLEDRFVVEGEDKVPGVPKGRDGIVGVGAAVSHLRGPVAGEWGLVGNSVVALGP